MMAMVIFASVIAVTALFGWYFVNRPEFGRLPGGERLERIRRSPQYGNGRFHNRRPTRLMTSDRGRLRILWDFLFSKPEGLYPDRPIRPIKTDLHSLPENSDLMVWFGHSSYLLQLSGRRVLVDPVFCAAAPVAFVNKPFAGTDIYRPEDMPDIDYLVITHDHWDHLDYRTAIRLKDRIRKVICPLGMGEHFEYWGFETERLIELDWDETSEPDDGFTVHCLPARHFSGRGLASDRTLWASFLLETPSRKVYIGGDSGYDTHFAEIGRQHPDIDLAVLENGQYDERWRYIHTLPEYLGKAARDLQADRIITVHHSKYALARHRWDEPLENEREAAERDSLKLIVPAIGQIVYLGADATNTLPTP